MKHEKLAVSLTIVGDKSRWSRQDVTRGRDHLAKQETIPAQFSPASDFR